ncbi:Antilisterial bacteriocin subtilosin biosynthesis protein AlbA [Streptomyces sp. YIM 121038]|uniref:radical SAM protein n=1 Tax=Streptomyces sp. YIM 121038 TaxID=2136401 RepID=UPI0011102BCC|nr:radical SAM protein [Streptomyces sp. YIM 121038]QCX77214.1 Antilisterial bacteriocin subtilosin biosynthesis protein AlbA [Streptomyces sp. YIM 121038]
MYDLIASPQQRTYLIARPGVRRAVQLPAARYEELAAVAAADGLVPGWAADAAHRAWGLDLAGRPLNGAVLVRPRTRLNYSRATWEVNKGCNFNCEHCYLAQRRFEGLPWKDKVRLIDMMCEAGVLWLQFTGGEPTIDRDFLRAYAYAAERGMLLEILTNGSRLHRDDVLGALTAMKPHKVTVSLYGASEQSADSLTRTPGSFRLVMKGLKAAREAGVPVEIAIIVTTHNAHEVDQMRAIAADYADRFSQYASISPTYDGQPDPLAVQAPEHQRRTAVFDGCPAGHTFFHVDPFGLATMCKIGRENPIDLMETGVAGLLGLPAVADAQMLRAGGCTGCTFAKKCRVCRPVAKAMQAAKAPLQSYCRHGEGT